MPSEHLSDLEKKGYGYSPFSGNVTGTADAPKYIYDPTTGKYQQQ